MHIDNLSNLPDTELAAYVQRARDLIASGELPPDIDRIRVELDGDYVAVSYYHAATRGFDRIRRITGYLTGDLKTWNDAKRAEERDRVKHL